MIVILVSAYVGFVFGWTLIMCLEHRWFGECFECRYWRERDHRGAA